MCLPSTLRGRVQHLTPGLHMSDRNQDEAITAQITESILSTYVHSSIDSVSITFPHGPKSELLDDEMDDALISPVVHLSTDNQFNLYDDQSSKYCTLTSRA